MTGGDRALLDERFGRLDEICAESGTDPLTPPPLHSRLWRRHQAECARQSLLQARQAVLLSLCPAFPSGPGKENDHDCPA